MKKLIDLNKFVKSINGKFSCYKLESKDYIAKISYYSGKNKNVYGVIACYGDTEKIAINKIYFLLKKDNFLLEEICKPTKKN